MKNGWEEVASARVGQVFADFEVDGIRVLVMRGHHCRCAYLGVPLDRPLLGLQARRAGW